MKERGNSFLKFVDRYFGIGLLFLLCAFKKKRKFPHHFQKIGLLKTAGIGDIVLLSAVIRDLKETYPEKKITLFTGRSNYEAALLIPSIEVIVLPITRPFASLNQMRAFSFDILIDFDPWPRINALLAFFSRSSYTIGFKTKKQFRHALFDLNICHKSDLHELDNYRELLKPLKVEPKHLPFFNIPPQPISKSKIALHLFAAGSNPQMREWPKKNWHALIEMLLRSGYEIVMTAGPEDADKFKEFEKYPSLQIAAGMALKEIAKLLKSCSLVVSVNTGIMHLAAAIGCKVICLHGPSTPKRWGAKGEGVIDIIPKHGYKPTLNLGFETKGKKNKDMEKITVDQVVEALKKIIDYS